MTHTFAVMPVLQVREDDDGRPVRFIWEGHEYQMDVLVESWEIRTGWWEATGDIWRQYFALITKGSRIAASLFLVVMKDMHTGKWTLAKVYD